MNTDAAGRTMLERFEGVVLHWYHDEIGVETGGVGHVRRPGDPDTFGQAEADAWLANDLRVVDSCLSSNIHEPIGQSAWNACASLCFNVGTHAFATSTVCRLINAGDLAGAADAFRLWNKVTVGGKLVPSANLTARREAERACFLRDVG